VQPRPLAVSEPLCASPQQVPDLVERIVLAAAVAVQGLLDTAADLTDHLGAELDDVVLPHHDTHHGRDGVVNGVFGPTFASFDEFALRIDRIHDAGGVVVFEGRVTGLTKADGRPDAPAAWLWTVRDGRIVSYHNNDLE
jgi:ketosteroid isomerase-like protein